MRAFGLNQRRGTDMLAATQIQVGGIDYAIMAIYIGFVLGIGWFLRRYMKTSSDFLESGRSIPAWVTGLAFISTNLGALEVMGMGASGAKYGIMTCHFYWVGAIPAMVFLGIFMMPFYYGSRARSVPEYLKLRFDEKTRAFNAFSFAVMTLLASGISMLAMATLLKALLGWNFHASLWISAIIVLVYTLLGGLSSAIYNEVLQFFLIVAGLFPLVFLAVKDVGGWTGLQTKLQTVSTAQGFAPNTWFESASHLENAGANPMGIDWFGLVMGLGFVLSFGYWCTNFLVVQRAMAADSMSAARRTPLIGAIPKMFIPALVILPGMVAIALMTTGGDLSGLKLELPFKEGSTSELDYNMTIPVMLGKYLPSGVLGLGLTALMASFMSGMAGNVTAFNTVMTYDIYQSYIKPGQSDGHYLWIGRIATVIGIVVSIGAAYLAAGYNNLMDFLQLIFAFVNAPLFATFLLGMFWKRTTANGAFFGLLSGTLAATIHHGLTIPRGAAAGLKGGWLGAIHTYPSEMAMSFWTAIWAWTTCFVLTIVLSLATGRQKSDEDLKGLVYSLTPRIRQEGVVWYRHPATLGAIVLVIAVVLQRLFW
jgi:solute:Na+ symporter, SSS family